MGIQMWLQYLLKYLQSQFRVDCVWCDKCVSVSTLLLMYVYRHHAQWCPFPSTLQIQWQRKGLQRQTHTLQQKIQRTSQTLLVGAKLRTVKTKQLATNSTESPSHTGICVRKDNLNILTSESEISCSGVH